jgi:carboxypeptidase Q
LKNDILDTANHDFYFTYHHSAGDAMTMMNADQLDDNAVAIASMLYIIADWDVTLPRN